MEGRDDRRACLGPVALPGPVRDARRAGADTCRPDRHLVRVREGRREARRGDGFADVWKRGFFAWEYKGKRRDLKAAYLQLQRLQRRAGEPAAARGLRPRHDRGPHELHWPLSGHPGRHARRPRAPRPVRGARGPARRLQRDPRSSARRTSRPRSPRRQPASSPSSRRSLCGRGHEPQAVAHFLDRILFCLFAEDAEILPKGVLSRLAEATRGRPRLFARRARRAVRRMAAQRRDVRDRARSSGSTAGSSTRPTSSRSRRPRSGRSSRSGAWTGRRSSRRSSGRSSSAASTPTGGPSSAPTTRPATQILRLVEPVVIRPLRREYEAMQARVTELLLSGRKVRSRRSPTRTLLWSSGPSSSACAGCACSIPPAASGNFLFVALRRSQGSRAGGDPVGEPRPPGAAASSPGSAPRRSSASRSTPTPPSSPGSRSGSVRSSGCSATASATGATRS